MTCQIHIHNEIEATVTGIDTMHHSYLQDTFSFMMPGAFFNPKYKLGVWDGKYKFYDMSGRTYTKILEEIVPFLIKWGYEIKLNDKREVRKNADLISADIFKDQIVYGGQPFMLRDYQVDFVNGLIRNRAGVGVACTGAGKTGMTAALSYAYELAGYNTITIVPSGDLSEQTFKTYKMLSLDTGRYDGKVKELGKTHTVATWQTLQNNPQVLADMGMLIVDETHGAKAAVIRKIINEYGDHIEFRYGVTGTIPKDEIDQYHLKVSLGKQITDITVKASKLIHLGFLAKILIRQCITVDPKEALPNYSAEKSWLERNEDRIDFMSEFIKEKAAEHGNTLVLVNSITFGRKLAKYMGPGVKFLSGSNSNDERWEQYSKFDDENDFIAIASFGIASTGISIDRIFCMITIDAGKSFIRTIQSIGRGLRKGKDKNEVIVYDVSSNQKYSTKHRKKRLQYYQEAEYPVEKNIKLKY